MRTRNKAYLELVNDIYEKYQKKCITTIYITYSIEKERALLLKEMILQKCPFADVKITGTIGSIFIYHIGSGGVGISY